MDELGFLVDAPPCRVCGKELGGRQPDGSYHRPAELYAGTYTGLCQRCTSGRAYLVTTLCDGAEVWSFPPHCPSWRRDRQTFVSYPDCGCNHGRVMVSRNLSQGGNYPMSCESCSIRYDSYGPRRIYVAWRSMPASVIRYLNALYNNSYWKRLTELAKRDRLLEGNRPNSKKGEAILRGLAEADYGQLKKSVQAEFAWAFDAYERAKTVSERMREKLVEKYGRIV